MQLRPTKSFLVEAQPSHAFDSRSSSTWLPAESYNVHASGREIDYRQEPVIFHVRDSGELVDPSRQQPRHHSETYWEGDSAEPQAREDVRFDPHYTQATRRPYQGMNGVCGHYVSLLECPHSNGGWKSAQMRGQVSACGWMAGWPAQSGDMQADYFSQDRTTNPNDFSLCRQSRSKRPPRDGGDGLLSVAALPTVHPGGARVSPTSPLQAAS